MAQAAPGSVAPKWLQRPLQDLLHNIMWDRDLFKWLTADGITEFLVKSHGRLTGVHTEFFIAEVTGNVLRKDHKGSSDPFSLHIIGDSHLAQTDGKSVHSGQKT